MAHVILGLRAVFLITSVLLCYNFFDLAVCYARRLLMGRRASMTVHRFGFAVWLAAAGATLANINHIFDAFGWSRLVPSDIPTAIGLALMSIGYFMHVSAKIDGSGGDSRRFVFYCTIGLVISGILFALLPIVS